MDSGHSTWCWKDRFVCKPRKKPNFTSDGGLLLHSMFVLYSNCPLTWESGQTTVRWLLTPFAVRSLHSISPSLFTPEHCVQSGCLRSHFQHIARQLLSFGLIFVALDYNAEARCQYKRDEMTEISLGNLWCILIFWNNSLQTPGKWRDRL